MFKMCRQTKIISGYNKLTRLCVQGYPVFMLPNCSFSRQASNCVGRPRFLVLLFLHGKAAA